MKSVVFDLDGVILDAKKLHQEAFMNAVREFGHEITNSFHENNLEALSTKQKIIKLIDLGIIPSELSQPIYDKKSEITDQKILFANLTVAWIPELLKKLKNDNYKIGMCSNSIKKTIELALSNHNIRQYFDVVVSNQDVSKPKPSSEPYDLIVRLLQAVPNNVIVFEDSRVGIISALKASCIVIPVIEPTYDLSIKRVYKCLNMLRF